MYTIIKQIEFSASHKLIVSNNGNEKCENLHGHNFLVTVYLKSEKLSNYGMVEDFTYIKKMIKSKLDHKNLNDIIPQPTAENIAKYIADSLGKKCFKVKVQESFGNIAIYEV